MSLTHKQEVADMPQMSRQLMDWLYKENPRVIHEWSKWDGGIAQGVDINNRQCARIDAFRLETGA